MKSVEVLTALEDIVSPNQSYSDFYALHKVRALLAKWRRSKKKPTWCTCKHPKTDHYPSGCVWEYNCGCRVFEPVLQ